MPTLLRVEGFRFFFFSNEGQEQPHVHVSKGDGVAKLWLVPIELAYASGLTPAELRRVRGLTRGHAATLVGRGHEGFCRLRPRCPGAPGRGHPRRAAGAPWGRGRPDPAPG